MDSKKFDGRSGQARDPRLTNTVFRAITGRTSNVSGQGSLVDMLDAAFGPGRNSRGVNTRAAAEALGVSRRTVQRWVAGDARPRPTTLNALRRQVRAASSTKRGRAAALRAAQASPRGQAMQRRGARLLVSGVQGPRPYPRSRAVNLSLDPADVQALQQSWIDGGDQGAVTKLEGLLDEKYVGDWQIDSLDSFELGH